MNVSVAGIGYVGLSLAVLLAQRNHVFAVDVVPEKVRMLEQGVSPIRDATIERFLAERDLDLTPTLDADAAYAASDLVIVAAPTSYDMELGKFDTSHVEEVVERVLRANPRATIVIKSTVPVGYTQALADRLPQARLLFSPEFLREGHALDDNLRPSRTVVGVPEGSYMADELRDEALRFAALLDEGAETHDVPVIVMASTEAEAVKLFANSYLALRVAFFNELDTYAAERGLSAGRIIDAVGLDPRVGTHYNNPSFGYGGYCLPKDTRQLLADFGSTPQRLLSSVVEANDVRKDFVADKVLSLARERAASRRPVVGIHRLVMKSGSDNFRSSAALDVIERLHDQCDLLIYEPTLGTDEFCGIPVARSLGELFSRADVIACNRWDDELAPVRDKVYTRDVYGRD